MVSFSVVDLDFLELLLCSVGSCCDGVCLLNSSFLLDIYCCHYKWLLLDVVGNKRLYGWWDLKFRYCPMTFDFRYTDDLNLCSV